ncbi:MAG: Gfo/Idh/MocA family protein [Candidatus Zipacnadales bacterium]
MIRIGIAGLHRGASFIGLLNARPDTCVAAVCATSQPVVAQVAASLGVPGFTDYDEFCSADLEAIVIATPPVLHAQHTLKALAAGKHVLCEVPAVWTVAEAQEVVRAVRESGLQYMFAENMCYFSYIQTMREIVQSGRLGELTYAEGEYIHDLRPLVHRADGMGGGVEGRPSWRAALPPIHYCTHDLGPILMMMEDRVISASGLHTGSRIAPELGSIDMEVGLFKTERGAVIKILCGFTVERPGLHWICVYGTRGAMEMDRFAPYSLLRAHFSDLPGLQGMVGIPVSLSDPHAPPEATSGGHGTSEYMMIDDFVRCIRDGTRPTFDVYDAMNYTLPGICAHQSAEQGGIPVAVPNPREW